MKRRNNLQDQVLEHIHSRLASRFGVAGADRIMQGLSTRLYEMTGASDATVSVENEVMVTTVENESGDVGRMADSLETVTTDTVDAGTTNAVENEMPEEPRFLTQLNNIVYPFIALMQVLEELPTDAASETLRIWNSMPWTVVDKARRSI